MQSLKFSGFYNKEAMMVRLADAAIAIIGGVVGIRWSCTMLHDCAAEFQSGNWSMIMIMAPLVLSILAIGFVVYAVMDVLDIFVIMEVCQDGVIVKYPFCKKKLINWDSFQFACVCLDYKRTSFGDPIVCLVKYGEKTSRNGRLKTWNPLHYSRLIRIDYSTENFEMIESLYPGRIYDLRRSPSYRK